jgi:hypothetical protein
VKGVCCVAILLAIVSCLGDRPTVKADGGPADGPSMLADAGQGETTETAADGIGLPDGPADLSADTAYSPDLGTDVMRPEIKADACDCDAPQTYWDAPTSPWPGCLEPVFAGVSPEVFCGVYAKVCAFTGVDHYASSADCMARFMGGSSDRDACKSGRLCRAAKMWPAVTITDCAMSGTASCQN